MHLLIPFAAPLSDAGRQALNTLNLPRLADFVARAEVVERDEGDELSLTPPHERVLCRALGWAGNDGRWPLAAWRCGLDGLQPGDFAWALLSPTHWHVGTDQVSLGDPASLVLDEAASRAGLAAVQDLFTSEGFEVRYGAPTRWYVAHESLAELACASLDRVVGRSVERWLPGRGSDASRLVRRLLNEVQMQLHEHPLNESREARGQLALNSVWISGCGRAQPVKGAAPALDERLRGPAWADDWAAWCKAWDSLEAEVLPTLLAAAARGEPARLTLCGERSSVTLQARVPSLRQRVQALWRRAPVQPLLEAL